MIDIRQSSQYASYMASIGWKVERIRKINYFIRKFPIVGAFLKVQRPEKIDFREIDKLCRKYRVFQVIIEPARNAFSTANAGGPKMQNDIQLLLKHGFKLSKSPYLPTKTLQIDLSQSRETIFSHFKKDARSAIKRAMAPSDRRESRGESLFTIHQYSSPNEIKFFREAWKNSVNYKRYVPSAQNLINLRKNFPKESSLFLASHNISGSIIGGVIFTTSSHERSNYITYYWQAFTNSEGRSSLSQYSLLWQGILWAKKHGYKLFDFEGIYDSRFPIKSWLGFTHFKRSFGGIEVTYPGCFTKFRIPL